MNPIYNLFITPIYLLLIYFVIAPYFAEKWTNKYTRKYFWRGLQVKLFGAIVFCGIYQFYYGGGDTTVYFKQGSVIVDAFLKSPKIGFEVFTYNNQYFSGESIQYLSKISYKSGSSTWTVTKITGLINLLTFKSFYSTALFFSLWSFLGSWKLVQLFTSQYKRHYKYVCCAILFIPSCIFWSSGIIKEAITTGGIGFFTYYFAKIIFHKEFTPKNISILFICFYLIKLVKGATIFMLFPCLGFWAFLFYYSRLNTLLRYSSTTIIVLSIPLILFFLVPKMDEYVENNEEFIAAQSTISGFQSDHGGKWREARGGHGGGKASTYHLSSAGDLSLLGMMKSFPEAIHFTLFRPFPWETTKVVQLMGAGESFAFLLITLYIFLKVGIWKTLKQTVKDPNLGFLLSYALLFGFIAGYISFNYGVLGRFKTPMMPFYTLFLVIHYQYSIKKTSRKRINNFKVSRRR
ncbi:hypothetical protein [Flammeovirga kamogawensis]|uniref:Glycosyltransferase RgtA/B/C/D-like domain-containing protein n=1 Tax=Flammeovirga kamogawensis TaxID=373891 RepID=A0ABX8GY21_9BACT|nr:hypothetical protein [Flammeovirga kamogawensis]MBB6460744.1 hypothetical protein [Flammeovirga kamogawensis]QWG08097.1 hypothetical protein KM029_03935 [Flammeovirga kamogawensis]TRX69900.1 hypothetical protein EO216_17875 [Flammeovirga kamogawensis]